MLAPTTTNCLTWASAYRSAAPSSYYLQQCHSVMCIMTTRASNCSRINVDSLMICWNVTCCCSSGPRNVGSWHLLVLLELGLLIAKRAIPGWLDKEVDTAKSIIHVTKGLSVCDYWQGMRLICSGTKYFNDKYNFEPAFRQAHWQKGLTKTSTTRWKWVLKCFKMKLIVTCYWY